MRTALSILACLLGEAIIIGAFLMFGRPLLADNVLILDIIVATIAFGLFAYDLFVPWISLEDPAQRKVGSLGLRWTANVLYALFVVIIIVVGAVRGYPFKIQLFIQLALLALLLLSYSGVLGIGDKVAHVHAREAEMRSTLDDLKNGFKNLLLEHDIADPALLGRIENVKSELRYLSASTNAETRSLEQRILSLTASLSNALDLDNIEEAAALLAKIEKLVAERKRNY